MKVILSEDIKNLGDMGAVVNVASGYARNYLLPQGLAVVANERSVRAMKHEQDIIHRRVEKLKEDALSQAQKLSAAAIKIKAKVGEEEKLFGSVTTMDIAEALKAVGLEVDKKKIVLTEPIKRLGEHAVTVKLGRDVTAEIKVEVEAETE